MYFVTQAPTDVPSSVLSQLGNRIQHALRAFTPDDADALRKTARTFPMTTHYDVERTITSLGIGEALVTVLSPKGVPTPLAATRLIPPDSRMAPLTDPEIAQVIAASPLSAPSTARPSTARAPTRSSRRGSPATRPTPPRRPRPAGGGLERAATRRRRTGHAASAAMTRRSTRRELQRQVRELAAAQRAAERERKAAGARGARRRAAAPADDRDQHPHGRPRRDVAARASR